MDSRETSMTATGNQKKIWTHSGDSHFLEPDDLWHQILPKSPRRSDAPRRAGR